MALLCRDPFTQSSFHAEAVSHTQAFKHRAALTNRPFAQTAFYTEHTLHTRAFTKRLLSTETLFTQRPSWQRGPFCITQRTFYTRRGFCTETLLHAEAFIRSSFYRRLFYTQSRFNTHAQALTWDPFKKRHTETPLHRDIRRPFCIRRPFHTIPHTQIRLLTEQLLHRDPFTETPFYTRFFSARKTFCTKTQVHTEAFTQTPLYTWRLLHRDPFKQKQLHRDSFRLLDT